MFRKVINKVLLICICSLFFGVTVQAETTYDVPSNSDFKSYMDYGTITNKKSKQYKLQQLSVTDANGLRVYDNRYCIALGNGFNIKVGDYVDVYIGEALIECVVGDVKQNIHTSADNMQVTHNGNVVEFIVEKDCLDNHVAKSGDISNIDGFEGNVDTIVVHDSDATALPDYTVVSRYSVDLGTSSMYILEYKYGNTTRTSVVGKDVYDSHEPFESLYLDNVLEVF